MSSGARTMPLERAGEGGPSAVADLEDAGAAMPPSQDLWPRGSMRLLRECAVKFEQDLSPSSLTTSVAEVVTFKGCEDLCRGTALDKVMHRQGQIFSTSCGSAGTFALSEPVRHIDAFLSHNWSVPRWRKFASLAVHFNFAPAVGVTIVAMTATTALTVGGLLPTYEVSWSRYPRGMVCRFLCAPVFLLALFSAHRASRKTVFLDVSCIDQVDLELQTRGIEKLGAFMRHSASMVVVYSDVYLKRLWTVYEIANFLALHPLEHMHIIPTVVPLVLVIGVVLDYVAVVSAMLLELRFSDFYYALRLTCMGGGYLFTLALRGWSRERAAMRVQLEHFTLNACVCERESDRPLVYGNIASLMRAARAAGRHASEEEALAVFDGVVRLNLSELMSRSMGSYGLKWCHLLLVSFLALGTTALDKLAAVASGMPLREVFVDVLWYVALVCFHTPLILVIWARSASVLLHLQGIREVLFVLCAVLPGVAFGWAGACALDKLVVWAYVSTPGLLALVASLLAMAIVNFLVFHCSRCT